MYNGQINHQNAAGQIKQNKIMTSDYSRPRKGSYCQYKQDKLTRDTTYNNYLPTPQIKQPSYGVQAASTRRSSLSFYPQNNNSQDMNSKFQKYGSKEYTTSHNAHNVYNKKIQYETAVGKNYDRFESAYGGQYRQYNLDDRYNDRTTIPEYRDYPKTRQIKQQSHYKPTINLQQQPTASLTYQKYDYKRPNQTQLPKRFTKNSDRACSSYIENNKNQELGLLNYKYEQPLTVEKAGRYERDRFQERKLGGKNGYYDYGEKQYNNLEYTATAGIQRRMDRQRDLGLEPYSYKSKQIQKKRPNMSYNYQRHYQNNQIQNQPQTPGFYYSKNYNKSLNALSQVPNNTINRKYDNNYLENIEIQPTVLTPRTATDYKTKSPSITPNRVKYSQQEPKQYKQYKQHKQYKQYGGQRQSKSSRKESLISKSKILRDKLNQLSADKKFLSSATKSTKQFHTHGINQDSKNQSYQDRLQRLKNYKDRVYQSPFKQTRSTSNLKLKYTQNAIPTQSDNHHYQSHHQTAFDKQQPKLKQNYASGILQRKQQPYNNNNNNNNNNNVNNVNNVNSNANQLTNKKQNVYNSIDNQCMSRINTLNSKINQKINSIISSYGK